MFRVIASVFALYAIYAFCLAYYGQLHFLGIAIGGVSIAAAIGLWLRKPWSQYCVYVVSVAVAGQWLWLTCSDLYRNGWPSGQSLDAVVALLPGLGVVVFAIGSSFVAFRSCRVWSAACIRADNVRTGPDGWTISCGIVFALLTSYGADTIFFSPMARLEKRVGVAALAAARIGDQGCPDGSNCTPQFVIGKVIAIDDFGPDVSSRYSLNSAIQRQLWVDLSPLPGDNISTVVFIRSLPMQHAIADYEEPLHRQNRRTVEFNVYPVSATFLDMQAGIPIGTTTVTPVPPQWLDSGNLDLHAEESVSALINCLPRKSGTHFKEEPLGCALPLRDR